MKKAIHHFDTALFFLGVATIVLAIVYFSVVHGIHENGSFEF
jgi:hypothetical protein